MTKEEKQQQALSRARGMLSMSNYPAIMQGFMAKGIMPADIHPRDNVFTFNAWKALGRSVKKGEHGVRVLTFVECSKEVLTEDGQTEVKYYRRPWSTTVFHISQTKEGL